ncbi:50S ribosomal protein L6 [Cesiribacter sp. SM1]|uniref:50S ribosomal protein L6 n=1 Tax=Cesiribacter sp. SM1 TaxID=2861196 RepID=UPI001CD672A9|nr:50S ribosomal protein L6 [Cesiribacter sp. SM1]
MSRVGKKPISIPSGVDIKVDRNLVTVKGPKGALAQQIDSDFTLSQQDGTLLVERPTEQKRHKALHGLYRALINNMVVGVSQGYKKELELVGVGYKAAVQGNVLELNVGYSHSIFLAVPDEIKVSAETPKGKNPLVTLEGIDKQLIGQIAAKIKSIRKVEPYKGKGIRFVGEFVRRKAGKSASKK